MTRSTQKLSAAACRSAFFVCFDLSIVSLIPVAAFVSFSNVETPVSAVAAPVSAVAAENALGLEPGHPAPIRVSPNEKSLTGNPLWAIPVSALSETVARPLFSPTRRPPFPPIAAASYVPPPQPPRPKEPDHPKLTLLGTVVGQSDGIAVVFDQTSRGVIRLKIGQIHAAWVLRSVRPRVATLEKDHQELALALPPPDAK